MFDVVEHFISLNGEGRFAGELALFIRFKGCNLSCGYCDTKWANDRDVAFTPYTQEALLNLIKVADVRHVTLTGGEPLIQSGIGELLMALSLLEDKQIEVETNGSIPLSVFRPFVGSNIHFTVDYKSLSSCENQKMCLENYRALGACDVVKAVVGNEADLIDVLALYEREALEHLYISPVFGEIELVDIVTFMKKHRMNRAKLQVQLHKVIWNPEERGV